MTEVSEGDGPPPPEEDVRGFLVSFGASDPFKRVKCSPHMNGRRSRNEDIRKEDCQHESREAEEAFSSSFIHLWRVLSRFTVHIEPLSILKQIDLFWFLLNRPTEPVVLCHGEEAFYFGGRNS